MTMTKTFGPCLMFLFTSSLFADDAAIQRYVQAQIAVVEAQIGQLNDAISLLSNEKISQEAAFDKIAQPSFKAVDDALQNNGFSHSRFYGFAYRHQAAIDQWLDRHAETANQLEALNDERELLTLEYDQLIGLATPEKEGKDR